MKLLSKSILALALGFSIANATEYTIDESHTHVGFSVKHLMITNVNGEFKTYNAEIDFDAKTKTFNKLNAVIDTASIDTDNQKRDDHLKSEDFFSSEKFPKMTFQMTSYKVEGDDGIATGNLTIRGITKEVKLKVEDLGTVKDFKNVNRVGFTLKGKINRMDYDLKWNKALEAGGVAVAEDVKIIVEVEAVEK